MIELPPSRKERYGVSALAVGIAALLSAALGPLFGTRAPLSPFTAAVIVAAWYGGLWAGLFATALAVAVVRFLFGSSVLSLMQFLPGTPLLISFAAIGVLISAVVAQLQRSHAATLGVKRRLEEVNKELLARTVDLTRSNEDLQQFAYAISHDLQTPLRNVQAYAELLIRRHESGFDDQSREFARYVIDGAANMQNMIRGLLEYSRATHDDLGTPMTVTDSNQVLQEALRDLDPRIRSTAAAIAVDPLPPVRLRDELLLRVFQNLLENALKFHGGSPPQIHVSASRDRDMWVFAVRDNGIGMDMRHAGQAFQLFQRLHHDAKYEGTGVGLAICRRIVERQGGRIWVESRPGKGSTFFFSVPALNDKPANSPLTP